MRRQTLLRIPLGIAEGNGGSAACRRLRSLFPSRGPSFLQPARAEAGGLCTGGRPADVEQCFTRTVMPCALSVKSQAKAPVFEGYSGAESPDSGT
jgi:hypothetical protein